MHNRERAVTVATNMPVRRGPTQTNCG